MYQEPDCKKTDIHQLLDVIFGAQVTQKIASDWKASSLTRM